MSHESHPEAITHPLTEQQLEIYNFLLVHTWAEAMREFGITSKSVMRTIVLRTALGLEWFPEHPGGPHPYLNYEKEHRLLHIVERASEAHQCLSLPEVATLAACLKREANIEAISSLNSRRCTALAAKIAEEVVTEPCHGWTYAFIERHALHSVLGRSMDTARTLACSRLRLSSFMLKFLPLFNRDPRLIFGADETDMKPSKRFKVVCPEGQQGFITETETKQKHITAMCAHSAGGAAVPPLLLLSQVKKLPQDLAVPDIDSADICWFASTERGYMTERAFYIWSLLFCTWLSGYRATIPPDEIKCANILLVMDGCYAHRCPEALRLFGLNNVTVLLLPSHTTHVMQPFDILIASSLKSHFRRFLFEEKKAMQGSELSKAARSRVVLVKAFLRAWNIAASPAMCTRSFEAAGLFPLCPSRVLESPFVCDDAKDCDMDWSRSILTSEDVIRELELNKQREAMRCLSIQSTPDDYQKLVEYLMEDCSAGRLLSFPPPMYSYQRGIWFIWKSFTRKAIPVLSQARIYQMMRQLSMDMSAKGDEILQNYVRQQEEERRIVEETVIRDAAQHFALGIADHLIHGSLQIHTEKLVSAEFQEQLAKHLLTSVQQATIDESVKTVLIDAISICATLTVDKLSELLKVEGSTNATGAGDGRTPPG